MVAHEHGFAWDCPECGPGPQHLPESWQAGSAPKRDLAPEDWVMVNNQPRQIAPSLIRRWKTAIAACWFGEGEEGKSSM